MKPEDNVLFVCKLNPVTTDEDLEVIFSRFGTIKRFFIASEFSFVKNYHCFTYVGLKASQYPILYFKNSNKHTICKGDGEKNTFCKRERETETERETNRERERETEIERERDRERTKLIL